MGKGNVCVAGPYEGLYYIDNNDLYVYRPKGYEYNGRDEVRMLRSISHDELGQWEYCDIDTQWWIDDVESEFADAIRRRFPSFTPCDLNVKKRRYGSSNARAILENKLFYIAVEDNEWSLAVQLLQKDDPWSDALAGLQAGLYQRYLDGIKSALFEQFESLGIYAGVWTSGFIKREDT